MTSTSNTDPPGPGLPGGTRRRLRRTVLDANEPVSPVHLAARAAAAEHGTSLEAAPGPAVRQCYLGLVNELLPDLVAAGQVRFDREANRVAAVDGAADPEAGRP